MSRDQLPTASDLQARLTACGMLSNPPSSNQQLFILEEAVNTAYARWQQDTGYTPFTAALQTRYFDPPGPSQGNAFTNLGFIGLGAITSVGGSNRLFLGTGVTSVTSITVGVSATDAGTVLTADRDYWLRPANASFYNRPYTEVLFAVYQRGIRNSIKIIGDFGFCPRLGTTPETWTIPDDAWSAILDSAMVELAPQLSLLISGGLVEWKEADVSERYNPNPYQAQIEAAQMRYMAAVSRYRQVRIT